MLWCFQLMFSTLFHVFGSKSVVCTHEEGSFSRRMHKLLHPKEENGGKISKGL